MNPFAFIVLTVKFVLRTPNIVVVPDKENLTTGDARVLGIPALLPEAIEEYVPNAPKVPDVVLAPDFIEHLMAGTSMDPRVGTICGRLLAIGRDLKIPKKPLIDSAGLYFTLKFRFSRSELAFHSRLGWGVRV